MTGSPVWARAGGPSQTPGGAAPDKTKPVFLLAQRTTWQSDFQAHARSSSHTVTSGSTGIGPRPGQDLTTSPGTLHPTPGAHQQVPRRKTHNNRGNISFELILS